MSIITRFNDETGMAVKWPLNAELNPICHVLSLLGAHHILHVSRIRVKIHFLILLHNCCLSLPFAAAPLLLPAGTVNRVDMKDEPTDICRIK